MNDVPEEEFASRTEEELHAKLEVVRSTPPRAPAELIPKVSKTLRWC